MNIKYCHTCGAQTNSDDQTCPYCGVPLGGTQNQNGSAGQGGNGNQAGPHHYGTSPGESGEPYYGQPYQGQPYQGQPYYGAPNSPFQQSSYNYNGNTNQYGNPYQNPPYPPKSKVAAGVLGILLGSLGVHNFYLGFTGKGVVQLLMTVLSCGMLSWVSAIWGIIEGIMILTGNISCDAKGVYLRD